MLHVYIRKEEILKIIMQVYIQEVRKNKNNSIPKEPLKGNIKNIEEGN